MRRVTRRRKLKRSLRDAFCGAFRAGWQFDQAAQLMAKRQAAGASGLTPIVVSLAFSMEVYLKCLRMIEGCEPLDSHDLLVLYKDLKENNRATLDAQCRGLD